MFFALSFMLNSKNDICFLVKINFEHKIVDKLLPGNIVGSGGCILFSVSLRWLLLAFIELSFASTVVVSNQVHLEALFQLERDIEAAARWKFCALSQEPLRQPMVACKLGRYDPGSVYIAPPCVRLVIVPVPFRLYNKEALIEALLNKSIAENDNAKHIRSLKVSKTFPQNLQIVFHLAQFVF